MNVSTVVDPGKPWRRSPPTPVKTSQKKMAAAQGGHRSPLGQFLDPLLINQSFG